MKKLLLLIAYLLAAGTAQAQFVADDPELDFSQKSLPPYSIRKININDDFTTFDFIDLKGKRWTNRGELTRPIIILTGKWALRHDIKKWAHHLAYKYTNFCDVIWAFNPDGTSFANHRQKFEDAMKNFGIAIPVVNDEHAIIGRSLKIEYDIPTIIGITRRNTLGFVYESPLNKVAVDKVESLLFTRLFR